VLHKINQSQRISSRNYYLFEQRAVIQLAETHKSLHVLRESHKIVGQQRLALEDVHESFWITHVDLSKGRAARHIQVSQHTGETTGVARPIPLLQLPKTPLALPAIKMQARTWLRKIMISFMTTCDTRKIQHQKQDTLDKSET
jgi:hypothetical protein